MNQGKLTFFCGKMGAGKSTLAARMAQENNAVLLSEDEWLESLYPGAIQTLQDYVEYSARLKPQLKKLVQNILSAGTNVVMDFPGNTVSQRNWLKSLFTDIDAPHELIYIDLPDEVCLARIGQRRLQQPERSATDTREMFDQVTRYFEAPAQEEGFTVIRHVSENQ